MYWAGTGFRRDATVVRFARKVAEEAENITREDVDELRDLGFSDADVFNVILVSAARCFFSKVVDATGTLPDAVLQEIPDQLRSALTVGREIASHAPTCPAPCRGSKCAACSAWPALVSRTGGATTPCCC